MYNIRVLNDILCDDRVLQKSEVSATCKPVLEHFFMVTSTHTNPFILA